MKMCLALSACCCQRTVSIYLDASVLPQTVMSISYDFRMVKVLS